MIVGDGEPRAALGGNADAGLNGVFLPGVFIADAGRERNTS